MDAGSVGMVASAFTTTAIALSIRLLAAQTLMEGATGGLVHPTDNLANLERNWPLVDFSLLGIDGVPVRAVPTALQGAHPTGTFTVP